MVTNNTPSSELPKWKCINFIFI